MDSKFIIFTFLTHLILILLFIGIYYKRGRCSNGEISKKLGSKLEMQQKNLCSCKKFNLHPQIKI